MSVELPNSRSWILEPTNVDASYRIDVALPERTPEGGVPLLIVLDGTAMFLTAAEFARTVGLVTMGELPQMAVVGVTCLTDDHIGYIASRFRDFTQVEWAPTGPFADDVVMIQDGSGRAADFLAAIVDEVLPAVSELVEVDRSQVGICGWSLSGLFASYAWRERPDVFSRLLAISPSLWWADAALVGEPLPARPAGHRAFVCAGECEEGDVSRVWPQKFANAAQREMAAMLRHAETWAGMCEAAGAATTHVVFADEHHVTVHTAALSRGIVTLFAG